MNAKCEIESFVVFECEFCMGIFIRALFDLDVSQQESTAIRNGLDSIPSSMLIPFSNLSIDAMRILGTGGTAYARLKQV